MKTTVKIVETKKLTPAQKETMWKIYQPYYNYSQEYFMQRLTQNTHFALYIRADKIGGFTGLKINHLKVDGKKRFMIYYGQTILPWGYRGASLLPFTSAKLILKYWKELLFSDGWFWYDSLNYKAYIIASKCNEDVYPNFRKETPFPVKRLIDEIGEIHYGNSYCPETGTVKKEGTFVKESNLKVYRRLQKDPDIAYFIKVNPGFINGEGLLTFTDINRKSVSNFLRIYLSHHLKKFQVRKDTWLKQLALSMRGQSFQFK